jgi:transcriptional regulator with XRE-family HTH domain
VLRRRDLWESLPARTQAALIQVRDLDAQHLRLSGAAPPGHLAGIRADRDRILHALEGQLSFAEIIAQEVLRAGSQTALADELDVSQSRISAWQLGGSLPRPQRMQQLLEKLGYDWQAVRGDVLDAAPPRAQITVAPRSLTVRIPERLQETFGLEDDVPERVRRLAWEAAAGAFQAVIRASRT